MPSPSAPAQVAAIPSGTAPATAAHAAPTDAPLLATPAFTQAAPGDGEMGEGAAALATCADLDAAWARNWPRALGVLNTLIAAGQACGAEPLRAKQYAAHFNYANALEQGGDLPAAVHHYQAAYALDPLRREARDALLRLDRLPPAPPPACLPPEQVLDEPYFVDWPEPAEYVAVQGGQLVLAGQPFQVRGVNYYPRGTPWNRFLPETDVQTVARELDLIAAAGFNTVRIFLWQDALFTCAPEDAVPVAATFGLLDATLHLARQRGLKVIVTLNDLPDLVYRPLYTDWARYDAQTAFIIQRYRDDPVILAWDLRNEGDLDYGAGFSETQVLAWLDHASQLVRSLDPNHLVTAGWLGDPTPTGPYVDFLAFHHWSSDVAKLEARVAAHRAESDLPLLLEEVGFSTGAAVLLGDAGAEPYQAERLGRVLRAAEAQGLAGWVVWTAFDFIPPPGQPAHPEHFFGLWRADLSPKPALAALPLGR